MSSQRIVPLSDYHRLPQEAQTSDFYKRLLEVVCNNATLALFIMDEHQECVYMNPAAETLTGYSLSETKGRALHDVVHHTRPDGRPYPLCECPIDQAFPQNNQEQGEEVFVHKDGHFYPVAYTASPIREGNRVTGTIIEVRDITQEKLAEQARQDAAQREQALRLEAETARQRVETVLSSISDGVFVLDRNWCYTYVNDRLCEMVGTSREELLGRNNWELFPAAVDTEIYVQFHQAMHEQVHVQFDYLYLPWNRWFEYRVYPSEHGITVFAAEITDRKRIKAEREQLLVREQAARAEAERANRIKDEFLAVVSHELRSPLNPILGWSSLLLNQKLDPAKATQALNTIARNAKLQAELIEDLLDVSRILRGKLSLNVCPVDLVATIQAALETVRLSAEVKSIHIHTQFEPEVGLVSGDSSRLQQVVWNLLSNAIKFTPPGGRVTIRLERLGSVAQITVSDTGKGIHPNFLPHVFDYFRQEDGATTRKFGGLGLGLAIVHHLVELHGGTMHAESPGEEQGATFTVKLPLISESAQVSQNDQLSEADSDLTGIQVLVVDDDSDTREFVAFLLEQAGARVVTAASAGEAFIALTRSQPDVLLSDIGMPNIDGYMLMRQVRALSPEQGGQIPAIALTAYAGDINYQQAVAAGFQHHIAKPIEPEALVKTIADLVKQNQLQ